MNLRFGIVVGIILVAIRTSFSQIPDSVETSEAEDKVKSTGIFSIGDQVFENSNYIYLPYDDWGVKGNIQVFGLPVTALTLRSDGLQMSDPVYGQIPLTWLNPRFDRITFEPNSIEISPHYFKQEKVFSRFDYYRGDYGFKNFSLLLGGKMPDSTSVWRFVAENLGYDSYYGILGAKTSVTGESISQVYRLDLQMVRSKWQIDLNGSYSKYLPGYIQTSPSSISVYLSPSSDGNVKEYRASIGGLATKATANDSTVFGFQQSNFVYGQFVDDTDFGFKGVADQSEVRFYHAKRFGRLRFDLNINPTTRSVTLRNGFYLRQNLMAGRIGLVSERAKSFYCINLGMIDRYFDGEMFYRYRLSPKNRAGAQLRTTYALYPLVYKLDFTANQPLAADGFKYSIASVDFQHAGRFLQLNLAVNQVNADFSVPYKSVINDTLVTYNRQKLDALFVTTNGRLTLPWRMSLTARSLLSNNENGVWLQGWGQIRQEIDLFKGNLCLYAAGEMTYWDSSSRLAWFEELRSVGNVGTDYFTNNRLNLVARIGGHIGDFHVFYVIYNAEGRAFATVSGMNYRNRLKIFGVEWQFLD